MLQISFDFVSKVCFSLAFLITKGQYISKQNCPAVTSPKKRTKRTQNTILSAFRSFFGRSYVFFILIQTLLNSLLPGLSCKVTLLRE